MAYPSKAEPARGGAGTSVGAAPAEGCGKGCGTGPPGRLLTAQAELDASAAATNKQSVRNLDIRPRPALSASGPVRRTPSQPPPSSARTWAAVSRWKHSPYASIALTDR